MSSVDKVQGVVSCKTKKNCFSFLEAKFICLKSFLYKNSSKIKDIKKSFPMFSIDNQMEVA